MQKLLKTFLFFLVVLCFAFNSAYSQKVKDNSQPKFSQVRIYATTPNDFQRIQDAGLFLDGGIHKAGLYFETWLSESEILMLKNSGVPYQITIDDWMQYYNSFPPLTAKQYNDIMKNSKDNYNITHSILGSMGGNLTLAQVNSKLDSLRLQYPTLVSVKWSIGNSYEGRPMNTVRITKNPDAPTGRPEIWYNGVTHAREPGGMENVLYYIYWLVENYNIDPIATYILNNREIYWTPIINVDGYYYNETTNPTGGGMWRANRHVTTGNCGYVDLNRNFGTWNFWNSANGGSSTDQCSGGQGTYRGVYPMSEPETQNWKNFVSTRNFRTEMDYHTYGNYLIKPYAWCDPTPTPDDAIFSEYGTEIVALNHFTYGTPYQTVGYYVRGGSTDWEYSTDSTYHSTHTIVYSPEVGVIGFWSNAANIVPEAQTCFYQNQLMSLVAGPYAGLKNLTFNKSTYTQNETGNVKVVFRNKGLMAASNIKVEFTPLNSYVTIPVQLYTKASLASRTSDSVTFNFTVSGTCPNGYAIPTRIRIKQNDSLIVFTQNTMILVGSGVTTFADSAENGTTNWTYGTGWAINTAQYHTPTHCFANANYGNNLNSSLSLNFPINMSAYNVAFLEFWQRYDVENGYDYCYPEVSNDNGTTWQQLSSYSGTNLTWTKQLFDISSMVNHSNNFRIRFRLYSDANTTASGWYVDDIKITTYNGGVTGVEENHNGLLPVKYSLDQNYPNPFNPSTQINYSVAKSGLVKISVYDILGREVNVLVNEVKNPGFYSVDFNGSSLSSGLYFYKMESNGFVDTKKMTLIK